MNFLKTLGAWCFIILTAFTGHAFWQATLPALETGQVYLADCQPGSSVYLPTYRIREEGDRKGGTVYLWSPAYTLPHPHCLKVSHLQNGTWSSEIPDDQAEELIFLDPWKRRYFRATGELSAFPIHVRKDTRGVGPSELVSAL